MDQLGTIRLSKKKKFQHDTNPIVQPIPTPNFREGLVSLIQSQNNQRNKKGKSTWKKKTEEQINKQTIYIQRLT